MTGTHGPVRPLLRCSIIGAGVSGLLIAYKLKKHLTEYVTFTIFEKSPELGGTWYENRYPGCACDVPSHVYQFPFALNPAWTKLYASSEEIQSYLKDVARHFDLERCIKYNSKAVNASWSESSSTWAVQIEGGPEVESEILINAGGILNNPQMPEIEGLSSFTGPQLHTAAWDQAASLVDKRVAIIGAGASAVQVLPKIQSICKHVDVYIRTPSWITAPAILSNADEPNPPYTEQDKDVFTRDANTYLHLRKGMEGNFNGMFRAFSKNDVAQKDLRKRFEARMKELIRDEILQERLIPQFEVGCRRINPGEQYLLALQEPNVEAIFEPIDKITETGVCAGGQHRHADVLIMATGFNTSFRPRFPIIGKDGVNLQNLWADNPVSYMGTGVAGFPNYLIFLGPNTPISNGSLMGSLEATSDYFIRLLRKMVRQGVRSFDVKLDAQKDFDQHTQEYMKDMVWTGTCRSWYKTGKKVTALWPGSSLHYMQTLAEDRWEDYNWTYQSERFAYWASGISWVEDGCVDPLGEEEREAYDTTTTIPRKGSDISFYLWKSTPLPRSVVSYHGDTGSTDGPVSGALLQQDQQASGVPLPV